MVYPAIKNSDFVHLLYEFKFCKSWYIYVIGIGKRWKQESILFLSFPFLHLKH